MESHRSGTKFRVIIVDGGPWLEGREMLRRLVDKGLQCSYVLITATSFVMREVSIWNPLCFMKIIVTFIDAFNIRVNIYEKRSKEK